MIEVFIIIINFSINVWLLNHRDFTSITSHETKCPCRLRAYQQEVFPP